MKVLHIGLGVRGRHWLEIVRDRSDITSVGCVDSEVAALAWVKARFPHLKDACYQEPDQAFREVAADAVIIPSPPALHASHAIGMNIGLKWSPSSGRPRDVTNSGSRCCTSQAACWK